MEHVKVGLKNRVCFSTGEARMAWCHSSLHLQVIRKSIWEVYREPQNHAAPCKGGSISLTPHGKDCE